MKPYLWISPRIITIWVRTVGFSHLLIWQKRSKMAESSISLESISIYMQIVQIRGTSKRLLQSTLNKKVLRRQLYHPLLSESSLAPIADLPAPTHGTNKYCSINHTSVLLYTVLILQSYNYDIFFLSFFFLLSFDFSYLRSDSRWNP